MAVMMLGVLTGCGGGDKKAAPAKAETKKELIVGTEPGFAPFEFQDEKTKDYAGFDMDLIRAIAKQAGFAKCTINNMGFDALIPALGTKNIDVIASGMTISEERAKKVTFTKGYYTSGLVVLVNKDNNAIKGIEDLKNKRIGAQIGTTGAMQATKVPGAQVKNFNVNSDAALELKNKGIDAIILDLPVAQWFLKQGGSEYAKIVGATLDAEEYGFAVSKDNKDLAAKLDKALAELQKNGEYDKLYKKWFGEAPKK